MKRYLTPIDHTQLHLYQLPKSKKNMIGQFITELLSGNIIINGSRHFSGKQSILLIGKAAFRKDVCLDGNDNKDKL